MRLGRRVRRLEAQQGDGWWGVGAEQMVTALAAAEAGVPLAELQAMTVELLARAERQGIRTAEELATLVAAEDGSDPATVLAAAADLLARWRGEWR